MPADAIITARQVRKTFSREGEVAALAGVDLEVRRGEFLSLIGPSGCGKSTFLLAVAGLVPVSSGELLLDGAPIRGSSRDRGLVFQEDALFPWMSVADNVGFGLRLRAARPGRSADVAATVAQLLRLVGLQGFERRMPSELSGGMKQRAAIAASLAIEPKLLLMDEPFGALDAQTRRVMQQELLRIHEASGRTTLFVTHDIREAITLSDRVAVMTARPGRIKTVVAVDLPRPRWRHIDDQGPDFLRLERRLSELLDGDIASALAAAS